MDYANVHRRLQYIESALGVDFEKSLHTMNLGSVAQKMEALGGGNTVVVYRNKYTSRERGPKKCTDDREEERGG